MGERAARAILDALYQGECHLHVPDLLFYEVGNILICGRARPPISVVEGALDVLIRLPLTVERPTPVSAQRAAKLARKLGLTFHDASYLALAHSLDCELVTADARLKRAARGSRVLLLDTYDRS